MTPTPPPSGAGRPALIAPDSGEAAARVLVLSIVADGRLAACEVQALDDADAYDRLGLDRDRFYGVMRAVCAELLDRQVATGESMFRLDGTVAGAWIDAVRDPALRRTVLSLAFEVIRSDGQLHPGESRVFWQLLDRWAVRLDEVQATRPPAAVTSSASASRPGGRVHRLPHGLAGAP
jgi:hypothetical protein